MCVLSEVRFPVEEPAHDSAAWALREAIRTQDLDAVRALLAQGALNVAREAMPRARLSEEVAIAGYDLTRQALLMALLDAPDPQAVSLAGLLEETFAQGHVGTLTAVLERTPAPEPLPWMGSTAVVAMMHERGARWAPDDLVRQLTDSVMRGRDDLVRFWIAQGADVQRVDANGDTLAHRLVDPPQRWGRTILEPLPLDVRRNLLGLLHTEGLDLDARDRDGQTVLLRALRPVDDAHRAFYAPEAVDQNPDFPSWGLALTLLELGCDARAVGPRGSALLMAFSTGGRRSGLLQALLDRGATLEMPPTDSSRSGLTGPFRPQQVADAWTRAIRSQDLDLARWCLRLAEPLTGPMIPTQDPWAGSNGLPPLVLAASQGVTDVVDLLVDAGADLQTAIDHPFWGRHDSFMGQSLCQEIPLMTPGGPVTPDDVEHTGRRMLERAMLRRLADRALIESRTADASSGTEGVTVLARDRHRL